MMNWLSSALGNRLASQLNGDWLKVRIARSFIQRYLGEFLEEKLRVEQLNVEISDGKAQISDLHLHVGNVNRRLEEAGFSGVELVSGFIESITVQVPWTNLLSQSTFIELDGLELTVRISRDLLHDQSAGNMNGSAYSASSIFMSESLLQSAIMNTSLELAGEVVSEAKLESSEDRNDATKSITQLIMQFLTQVCVTLTNVRIRFEFAMNLSENQPDSFAFTDRTSTVDSTSQSISPLPTEITDSMSISGAGPDSACLPRRRSNRKNNFRPTVFSFELRINRVDFFDAKASFATARGVHRKENELRSLLPLADDSKCICKHLLVSEVALYFSFTPTANSDDRTDLSDASLYYSVVSRLHLDSSPERADTSSNSGKNSGDVSVAPNSGMTCIGQLFGRVEAHVIMCTMPDRTDRIALSLQLDPVLSLITPKTLSDLLAFSDCLSLTTPSTEVLFEDPATLGATNRQVCFTLQCALCVVSLLHEDEPRPLCVGPLSTGDALKKVSDRVRDAVSAGEADVLRADGRLDYPQFLKFLIDRLGEEAPVDHLRLVIDSLRATCDSLDAPRGRDDAEIFKTQFSVANAELDEVLYVRQAQQSTPILRFADVASTSEPVLKMTYSTDWESAALRVETGRGLRVEMDVSIADRLHVLAADLRDQQSRTERIQTCAQFRANASRDREARRMKQRFRPGRTRRIPLSDDEPKFAIDFSSVPDACKRPSLSTNLSISSLELRLRVPVPDRRSAEQRFDWYLPHLRDDSFVLKVDELVVRLDSSSCSEVFEFNAFCNRAALLLECGSSEQKTKRVPIAFACGRQQKLGDESPTIKPKVRMFGDDSIRLQLKVRKSKQLSLSLDRLVGVDGTNDSDVEHDADADGERHRIVIDPYEDMTPSSSSAFDAASEAKRSRRQKRPTPFAKTRDFLSEAEFECELLTPANGDDLRRFQADHETISRVHLAVELPSVIVELPSRTVLEIVYNRLMTDLALWRPIWRPSLPIVTAHTPCIATIATANGTLSESEDESRRVQLLNKRLEGTCENRICVKISVEHGQVLAHNSADGYSFYASLHSFSFFNVVPVCVGTEPAYTTVQLTDIELFERRGVDRDRDCRLLDEFARPIDRENATSTSFAESNEFSLLLNRSQVQNPRDGEMVVFSMSSIDLADANSNHRRVTACISFNNTCKNLRLPDIDGDASADGDEAMARRFKFALASLVEMFRVREEAIVGYEPPLVQASVYVQVLNSRLLHLPHLNNNRESESFRLGFAVDCGKLTIVLNCADLATSSDNVLVRFLLERVDVSLIELPAKKRGRLSESVRVLRADSLDFALRVAETSCESYSTAVKRLDARCQHLSIEACADSIVAFVQTIQYVSNRLSFDPVAMENESRVRTVAGCEPDAAPDKAMTDDQRRLMADAIIEPDVLQSATDRKVLSSSISANANADVDQVEEEEEEEFDWLEKPNSVPLKPEWCNLLKSAEELQRLVVSENHFKLSDETQPGYRSRSRAFQHCFNKPSNFPCTRSLHRFELAKLTFQFFGGADLLFAADETKSSGRDLSRSLLLTLTDVQFQHEDFDPGRPKALKIADEAVDTDSSEANQQPSVAKVKPLERHVLLVRTIELDDQLTESGVHKFLHPFYSDEYPQRTDTPLICTKLLHVDADSEVDREFYQLNASDRADDSYLLKISALPIRINLHQTTLLFCIDVAHKLTQLAASASQQAVANCNANTSASLEPNVLPTGAGEQGVFFKTVIFERDVMIVLDYVGGNQFDLQYGAFAAVVGSLTQLRDCRFVLKRVVYRRGLLGFRSVLQHLAAIWYQDVSAKKLVVAFEPVSFAMRLLRGLFDLFYEPFDQFRRNRSVLTGVKRGCRSFTQSTGVAALELLCRFVQCLEWLARVAQDVVSPQSVTLVGHRARQRQLESTRRVASSYFNGGNGVTRAIALEDTMFYDEAFRRSEGVDEDQLFADPVERTCELKTIRVKSGVATVAQQAINAADNLQLLVQGLANHIDPHRKAREEKKWKSTA